MTDFNKTDVWLTLQQQQTQLAQQSMSALFAADPRRAQHYTIQAGELQLDFSKNIIDDAVLVNLLTLAEQADLSNNIEQLLLGEKVNYTEHRAAWHTALRDFENNHVNVEHELRQMERLAARISVSDIKHVVNLGIGGSDLGPALVVEALQPYHITTLKFHFVSNVDPSALDDILAEINPQETLFIVSSKSFTTLETLTNATVAKKWLSKHHLDLADHMYAVTTKPDVAERFGIKAERIMRFWDWVGGRYSLWSSIGFSIVLAIGMNNFKKLLRGAFNMDKHFASSPLRQNMPVIMALLSVWYVNFWKTQTQAILPYDQHLRLLPDYLQQLVMESNGKQARRDGSLSDEPTSPIIWGQVGTNGQHAFYQLLHQGTVLVPIDFILPVHGHNEDPKQQQLLVANCIAQSEALMLGKHDDSADNYYPGNRPSNTILMPQLNPQNLGALIALYEHKTYVESVLWRINAFDQPGVELGKQLTQDILIAMQDDTALAQHDSSTQAQINYVNTRH